jgi:hypothetical protein
MRARHAGPVLQPGPLGEAVVAALRELNPDAQVIDRGSYLRVLVSGRCRLTRAAVEARIGRPFRLPEDLERVLAAHSGEFHVSEDEAVWEAPSNGGAAGGP